MVASVLSLAVVASLLVALSRWGREEGQAHKPSEPRVEPTPAEPVFTMPPLPPQASAEDLKREAIRIAEELLQAYPDGVDSLRVAANLQSHLGNSDVAATLWERSVAVDPNDAEAYFRLGLIAGGNGAFEEAATMFGRASLLAPDEPLAPARQADALMKIGRVEEAVAILENHARKPVLLDKTMLTLGQAYLQLNELEKAKETYEYLIRADPAEARAYYGLARVCAKLGQTRESQQYLETFRSLAAVNHEALVQEKRAYVDSSMLRELLATTLVESARVYRGRGSTARAEAMWRAAADLQPENPASQYELLKLYEIQHRDLDALEIGEHLCRVQPGAPDHWLFVGLLYYRLDRYDDALAALRRATQLDPGNPKYERAYARIRGLE
ncbi:MAG: tetratricopeptide repeat protein [Pirellulaceae bacterium]